MMMIWDKRLQLMRFKLQGRENGGPFRMQGGNGTDSCEIRQTSSGGN